jgi:hypothetical protein
MECRDKTVDLKHKLKGTKEEIIIALQILQKDEYLNLAEKLKQDVIALAGGDSIEICRAAGELLLRIDPDYVAGQSWLVMRLASTACSGNSLGQRLSLIIAMAELNQENHYLYIERCPDRDNIVDSLMSDGQWWSLLSLLRVSLLCCKSDAAAWQDMFWLIRTLLRVKNIISGKEAVVFLKQPGKLKFSSKMLGYIIIEEAMSAAAGAWVRCLKGPGGTNICLENNWVFEDTEMAAEILENLAAEPVAFTSLMEANKEDAAKKVRLSALPDELTLFFLSRGIMAAEYSLSNLLKEVISIILERPHMLQKFSTALESSHDRVVAVIKALLTENNLPGGKELMQFLESAE